MLTKRQELYILIDALCTYVFKLCEQDFCSWIIEVLYCILFVNVQNIVFLTRNLKKKIIQFYKKRR
jgi:hypothetical protein